MKQILEQLLSRLPGYVAGLSFAIVLMGAQPALAAVNINEHTCGHGGTVTSSAVCRDSGNGGNPLFGPHGLLTVAIQILAIVVGVAAVVSIIISGFRFVTANGDNNTIASARAGVIYSLVGVVIAAMAQAIISFVLYKL